MSQTIVRKVKGGSDPARHRFILVSESRLGGGGRGYRFDAVAVEMTMAEVYAALIAAGFSEVDAMNLIREAAAGPSDA